MYMYGHNLKKKESKYNLKTTVLDNYVNAKVAFCKARLNCRLRDIKPYNRPLLICLYSVSVDPCFSIIFNLSCSYVRNCFSLIQHWSINTETPYIYVAFIYKQKLSKNNSLLVLIVSVRRFGSLSLHQRRVTKLRTLISSLDFVLYLFDSQSVVNISIIQEHVIITILWLLLL